MYLQNAKYNPNGKLINLLDDIELLVHPKVNSLKEFIETFLKEYDTKNDVGFQDITFYNRFLSQINSNPFFLEVFSRNKINGYCKQL